MTLNENDFEFPNPMGGEDSPMIFDKDADKDHDDHYFRDDI